LLDSLLQENLIKMAFSFSLVSARNLTSVGRVVGSRFLSTSSIRGREQRVESVVNPKGFTVISMNKGPVNSLNLEFLQEIKEAVVSAESSSKGIVLTSSLPTIFCAGLEITEMYKPDQDRLRLFWGALQDLFLALYGCKVPTVAAINGHSPAGGCLLSMCCDYRVMVGPKFTIGLNETQLGIVAPFWFKDAMVGTVGTRQTELALMLGTLFSTQQALSIGLVDSMVDNKEEALAEAEAVITKLMKIPSEARHVSKMLMRQDLYDSLSNKKTEDIDFFANFIVQPAIQKPMGMYLQALQNKSKNKK